MFCEYSTYELHKTTQKCQIFERLLYIFRTKFNKNRRRTFVGLILLAQRQICDSTFSFSNSYSRHTWKSHLLIHWPNESSQTLSLYISLIRVNCWVFYNQLTCNLKNTLRIYKMTGKSNEAKFRKEAYRPKIEWRAFYSSSVSVERYTKDCYDNKFGVDNAPESRRINSFSSACNRISPC